MRGACPAIEGEDRRRAEIVGPMNGKRRGDPAVDVPAAVDLHGLEHARKRGRGNEHLAGITDRVEVEAGVVDVDSARFELGRQFREVVDGEETVDQIDQAVRPVEVRMAPQYVPSTFAPRATKD